MGSIQKFATFEEAEQGLYCFEPGQEYFERVARFWDFVDWVCPREYARGMFRYRSIEEANEQAEKWLELNTERLLKRRKRRNV